MVRFPDVLVLLPWLWLLVLVATVTVLGYCHWGLATRSQSLSKMLRLIPDDHIASDWSNRCNSALTLRALKMSKIKNLKRSNFSQPVFFRAQNALCGKMGGASIELRVSKQDGMVFSSSPTYLSFVRVNPPIPTQFWCRNQKIWGKRIPRLKSTWV